ncbi:uncharacterized protein SOCE26_037250 [Sorangium cellulosum]|uniref:Uncharacterized protein n=1 Tax=Sorangium cellulosum TaxID=56 RepID=A0A2L0ESN5_SORCE|nr:uncharacterized protein SOCE26_037250 [Sorangium cellulosum]
MEAQARWRRCFPSGARTSISWTTFARTGKPGDAEKGWPLWSDPAAPGRAHRFTKIAGGTETVDVAVTHGCEYWIQNPLPYGGGPPVP